MHIRTPTALRGLTLFAALATWSLPVGGQEPVPTTVVVRAVAQDAKIIGSGVGGARITIRDSHTGEVLASGIQEGGTGDTPAIMGDRPRSGGVFAVEGGAYFSAELQLSEPTAVVVEAAGPLGTDHAIQHASVSLLLVPGHDIVGDGVVITLHGFTVEVVEAPSEATAGGPVAVRARITMLCGCPTQPGGMWDADEYDLSMELVGDAGAIVSAPLNYAGETSTYEGELAVPAGLDPGMFELRIIAVHASRANAGMVVQPIRIGS